MGSSENADWITNFKFFLKRLRLPSYANCRSKIKVHSEYLDGWEHIRAEVLSLIHSSKVLVTGFSMGGGLSSIIAVDIQYNIAPRVLVCVDFEGPRVWNRAGQKSYNQRVPNTIKVTYGNDVVPKIPPFYRSVGIEIHLGNKKHWWRLSAKDHTRFKSGDIILPLISNINDDEVNLI